MRRSATGLNACLLDYARPQPDFIADDGRQPLGGGVRRKDAVGLQAAQFGLLKEGGDLVVQARDDRARRAAWRDDGRPEARDEAGERLGDRGEIGKARHALLGGDGKGPQAPGLDVLHQGARPREDELNLATEQFRDRGPLTLVRHVKHSHAGQLFEQCSCKVQVGARSRGGVSQIARA